MKTHLIGRSTTTYFNFSTGKPIPVFEDPVPTNGVLMVISEQVVPENYSGIVQPIVLEPEYVQEAAAELKSDMDKLKKGLNVQAITDRIKQEHLELAQEDVRYEAENPRFREAHDRVMGAFTRGLVNAGMKLVSSPSSKTKLDYAIESAVEEVLAQPFNLCGKQDPYFDIMRERGGPVDGYSTERFSIDNGLPFNGSLGTLVPRLVFDLVLARKLDAELVLNSTTRREMQNAQTLLSHIENHDFAGYMTFQPKYD